MKKLIIITGILLGTISISFLAYKRIKKVNFNSAYKIGQPIDSLDHVSVFYNGGVDNVVERNTKDGYNLGLKYQCVEFVKRYYYEHFNHKMPDSYGHAKSFYNASVLDGELNTKRDLIQYTNPSKAKPKKGSLIVMKGAIFNPYGHVAIISKVSPNKIEIIQQNAGPFSETRETFKLTKTPLGKWKIENNKILGWLHKN